MAMLSPRFFEGGWNKTADGRPLISTFAGLMSTPGGTTGEPWSKSDMSRSRELSRALFAANKNNMSLPAIDTATKQSITLGHVDKSLVTTITPSTETGQTMKEQLDQETLNALYEELAADLTLTFSRLNSPGAVSVSRCTLIGPASLTVEKHDGSFSKLPFIGGEGFVPVAARLGKRGKIIISFRSDSAAGYKHMEMMATDALSSLSGFSAIANTPDGTSYLSAIKKLNENASALRDQESAKGKFEQYADIGFGSF